MRILLPFLAVLALAGPLAAQAPVAPEPQSPFPDSVTVDEGPSPLGVFRALQRANPVDGGAVSIAEASWVLVRFPLMDRR